ncbi:MAG: hypothetical protein Q8R28_22560 [Dehalococcoidia bacterium]|nr:hypothetical protein [Dehalococcoidia bacterium]
MPGSLSAEVAQLFNALLNGPAVSLTRWPLLPATGLAVTGSGMTTGAYKYAAAGVNQVQLVTAALNTAGMWIASAGLDTISIVANEIAVLAIGRGTIPAGVRAAHASFAAQQVTAVGQFSMATVTFPLPVYVAAAVGISLDLANATANDVTAQAHLNIYTGLGQ